MARPKSGFLSGFGTALEIFKGLTDAVLARGGSDDDLRRVIADLELRNQLADLIVGSRAESFITHPTYRLTINYDQTLAEMVSAGGYDTVNSDITADHFPVKGEGKREVEVTLFHFNRVMTSKQVIAELDRAGYRPGKIEELLALGAEQPDIQRQFPIICLGSGWRHPFGNRYVTSLDVWSSERELVLCWFGSDWFEDCRFLAVRK